LSSTAVIPISPDCNRSAPAIAGVYRKRWQVETLSKRIKQNRSIRHFFGNSINAVESQIWNAGQM